MADSNARPHVQTLWEASQGHALPYLQALQSARTLPNLQALQSAFRGMLDERKSPYPGMLNSNDLPALKRMRESLEGPPAAFKSAYPGMFNSNDLPALKRMRESLATLPATWPANHEWITPNRQPSPREPSSPRPATPPPSPLDDTMQAVQNKINLADQQEAHLQQLLDRQEELTEKQHRVATLQLKLQAVSQPVRSCQHCHHPLFIHLADDTLEPCTRSNRFNCGYDAEGRLVGNRECIKRRNAAKGRRKYAARKVREQAGNTAPGLYVIDGKARPQ